MQPSFVMQPSLVRPYSRSSIRNSPCAALPDEYYRLPTDTPHELYYPQSKGQRKYAGRVEHALSTALGADSILKERLVALHGLCVHQVRVSSDRRKVGHNPEPCNPEPEAQTSYLKTLNPSLLSQNPEPRTPAYCRKTPNPEPEPLNPGDPEVLNPNP